MTTAWTPDATELADRIRSKAVSAAEVVEEAIRKAEALDPRLGAIVTTDYDRALDKAKAGQLSGPFAGAPFLVKDLDPYKGLPTYYGSRSMRGAGPDAEQTPYIDAFDAAGLVTIGKSATPEYGFLPTTEPMGFAPTRNPWNLDRSAGGSSGGAAAAVAAGIVPVAHASDGGGSIRIPSANCGLFGLKPSRGRMLPNRPSTWSIDLSVSHVVSRSVRDSAAMFAATQRADAEAPFAPIGLVSTPLDRALKVGLVMNSGGGRAPDPEVRTAVENAARLLEDLGHRVEPTVLPMDGARFGMDFTILWASGAADLLAGIGQALGRKPDADVVEPFSLAMAELVGQLPPDALPAAIERLNDDMRAYDAWLTRYDVILSPVLGQPPVELGYVAGWVAFPDLQQRLNAYVGYTPVQNVAGAPAMSAPLHWTAEGLPVGVQIAGRAGDEATLLGLAYQLEEAQPWAHRRPPVSA